MWSLGTAGFLFHLSFIHKGIFKFSLRNIEPFLLGAFDEHLLETPGMVNLLTLMLCW